MSGIEWLPRKALLRLPLLGETNPKGAEIADARRTEKCRHPPAKEVVSLMCQECRIWVHANGYETWEPPSSYDEYTTNWVIPEDPIS